VSDIATYQIAVHCRGVFDCYP